MRHNEELEFRVVGGDYGVGTLINIEGIVAHGDIVRARVNPEEVDGRIVMKNNILYLLFITFGIAGFFVGGPVGVALGVGFAFLLKNRVVSTLNVTIEYQDGSQLVVGGIPKSINRLVSELREYLPM